MEQEYCPYCMNPVAPGEACPNCGLTAGAYTPSPHHLPPGTVLQERYLVERVLGEGGFGSQTWHQLDSDCYNSWRGGCRRYSCDCFRIGGCEGLRLRIFHTESIDGNAFHLVHDKKV